MHVSEFLEPGEVRTEEVERAVRDLQATLEDATPQEKKDLLAENIKEIRIPRVGDAVLVANPDGLARALGVHTFGDPEAKAMSNVERRISKGLYFVAEIGKRVRPGIGKSLRRDIESFALTTLSGLGFGDGEAEAISNVERRISNIEGFVFCRQIAQANELASNSASGGTINLFEWL